MNAPDDNSLNSLATTLPAGDAANAPVVVVVGGEGYWQEYLPGCRVVSRRIQDTSWALRQGELWAIDRSGGVRVDAILWRVGAVRPTPAHHAALQIARLSGVPCVNAPDTLLQNENRLSMLHHARALGLPVISFDVVVGERMLARLAPLFPVVVKVGSYHGGCGKTLVQNEAQWLDIMDVLFVSEEFVTVEPFIDYAFDIRCLAIGNKTWAMKRRGKYWKANQLTTDYALMDVPDALRDWTRRAMNHASADILGLDFVQTRDGEYLLLEVNDVPGLTGWPDETRIALAACLTNKMRGHRG